MVIAITFAIFIIAIILFNYIFITEVIDHISNMELDLNNSKLLLEIEDYKNKIEELEKLNYELNEEFNKLSIDYLKLIKNSDEKLNIN